MVKICQGNDKNALTFVNEVLKQVFNCLLLRFWERNNFIFIAIAYGKFLPEEHRGQRLSRGTWDVRSNWASMTFLLNLAIVIKNKETTCTIDN